jgi:hypothetical protein
VGRRILQHCGLKEITSIHHHLHPFATTDVVASQKKQKDRLTPQDNYPISCGTSDAVQLDDRRTFRSVPESTYFLSTQQTSRSQLTSLPLVLHHYLHLQEFFFSFQKTQNIKSVLRYINIRRRCLILKEIRSNRTN